MSVYGPTELFQVKNFTVALTKTELPVVDARVIINVGSSQENKNEWGTAHFLEHMFFKGTLKKDYKEINKITSKLGRVNAHTGTHGTAYEMQFLPKDLNEALDVLIEMTFSPALPNEEAAKEVGVILEEHQMYLDRPASYFWNNVSQFIVGDKHGHSIIGTAESIKSTTVQKMRSFLDRFYTPGNILISVVGNVEKSDLEKSLEQYLPDIPDSEKRSSWEPDLDFRDVSFNHKSKQAMIAFASQGMAIEETFKSGLAIDVFCNALGGGMHSLLFDRLREELGLCYSVWATNWSKENYGLFLINLSLDERNIGLAKEEIAGILDKVKKEGFDPEILDISKTNEMFSTANALQTNSAINNTIESYFHLSSVHISEYLSYETREQFLQNVSNDDMVDVANKLFGSQPLGYFEMTQEKKVDENDEN